MSIQQCTIWRRAHHLNIFELLDNHFQSGKGIKMPTIWDIVFNKSEIEFRIFRDIFYEMYKIQKKALAFDVYTENMFERFVSFIIEIRPFDRFLLCCILLINLGRMELRLYSSDCGQGDLTDAAYIQCKDNSLIILFTILGSVLFVITCLVAVWSRRIEIGILHRSGITSYKQYAYFLQNMEGNLIDGEDASAVEIRRLSKDDLKFAAIEGLQAAKREKLSGPYSLAHRLFPSKFSGDVADLNIFDKLTTRISYDFHAVASGATPHPTQYGAGLRAYLPILGEFEEKNGDEEGEPVGNYIPEAVKEEPRTVAEAKPDTHGSQKTTVRSFDDDDDSANASSCTIKTVPTISEAKIQQATKSDEADTSPCSIQTSNARSRKNFWTEKTDQPYISVKSHSSPLSRGTAVHPLVHKTSALNATSKSLSSDSSSHTNSGNWTSPPVSTDDNDGSDRVAPQLLSYKQHLNATKNVTKTSHSESGAEYARKLQSHSQLASLFPLSSPDFFFEVVHCLIMLISFYMALYLTSFIASTADAKWKAVSLLPGLCGIAVFICLVRSAALIHAIYRVNFDAILEVQEQTESTEQMQVLVRQTILMKLMIMAGINLSLATSTRTRNPPFSWGNNGDTETKLQAQLDSLFTQIDTSGDGKLSQAEFVSFMKALNISISKKKWIQVRVLPLKICICNYYNAIFYSFLSFPFLVVRFFTRSVGAEEMKSPLTTSRCSSSHITPSPLSWRRVV